ncbi:MAG: flagellar hook-basal body complex protein, partial [Ruthenibacterium sp.]
MKAAFYAGSAGLIAQQRALDIIGNNIANVNTNGYQSQAVGFQQLLNAELYANTPSNPTSGYGVRADTAGLRNSSTFRQTGFMLDFAIAGDGFFAVQK